MAKFDLKKFLAILNAIAPVILLTVPGGEKVALLVPVIVGAIGEAQAIPGATGPEKKAHVLAIVAASVTTANATGKVTLDPAEVAAVADKGIDAVVGTIHVVNGAKIVKALSAASDDVPARRPDVE
jgi:hypothetical protein